MSMFKSSPSEQTSCLGPWSWHRDNANTLFQDSNADSNDGGDDADDADDEFECDCAMCHNIGGWYTVVSFHVSRQSLKTTPDSKCDEIC